jgi:hypothetical protein
VSPNRDVGKRVRAVPRVIDVSVLSIFGQLYSPVQHETHVRENGVPQESESNVEIPARRDSVPNEAHENVVHPESDSNVPEMPQARPLPAHRESDPEEAVSKCIGDIRNLIKPAQNGRNPTLANVKRRIRRKDGGVAQRIGKCFEQVLQLVDDRLCSETGQQGLITLELVLEHMKEGKLVISKCRAMKENTALVKTLLKTHAEGGRRQKAVIRGGMAFTGEVSATRVASLLHCHKSSVHRSRRQLTTGRLHQPVVPGVRWTVPETEYVTSHLQSSAGKI